ncbi:hypothetical protein KDJ57_gp32 [Gordonia phage Catfish]|uniref:Uncharacterized protein n=1 Tax=Gordonia phage Catfish TaxID=2301538 RepID=A0A385D0N9_9CAUD|nr:hypothetical protein KDJ57_gp32 [Gordonia phage Catfish]AXQ51913.1 hypothetical protein SEA_CATFISH_77 [Gordonia phage Catfish]
MSLYYNDPTVPVPLSRYGPMVLDSLRHMTHVKTCEVTSHGDDTVTVTLEGTLHGDAVTVEIRQERARPDEFIPWGRKPVAL